MKLRHFNSKICQKSPVQETYVSEIMSNWFIARCCRARGGEATAATCDVRLGGSVRGGM